MTFFLSLIRPSGKHLFLVEHCEVFTEGVTCFAIASAFCVLLPSTGSKEHNDSRAWHKSCSCVLTWSNMMLFQPVSSEDHKKNQKAVSSVDLTKTDSLRKNSQDGRFVSVSLNIIMNVFDVSG